MADDRANPPIFEVPYLRLFPWLRLFRVPGAAADPKRLMLAALGLVLTHAGWAGLDRVFPGSTEVTPVMLVEGGHASRAFGIDEVAEPFHHVASPFVALFDPTADGPAFAHAACAAVWVVLVWGLLGGAIARSAAVSAAKFERITMREALRFALGKPLPLLGTPFLPMLGVAAVAGAVAAFGLVYRIPGAGPTVGGALAVLPLIGGLLLTLVLIGLWAGWPLMPASVAAEAEDGFDAMSRAYAYVHQRPWHYAAYAALAATLGWVGAAFVRLFADLVVRLAVWALEFGAPAATVAELYGLTGRPADPAHGFWLGVVGLFVHAWAYSYFWSAATVIYLLLRLDVDGKPFHAVAHRGRPNLLGEAAAAGPARVAEPASAVPAPHAEAPPGQD